MLGTGHVRQAQICAEQGLKVLASITSDIVKTHQRTFLNCSKSLSALATAASRRLYSSPLPSHGHPLGVSALYAVRFTLQFIHERGPDMHKKACDISTAQICASGITSETFPFGLAFVDSFAREGVAPATTFVSHSWGCPWLSLVQAMVLAEMQLSKHGGRWRWWPLWPNLIAVTYT